MIYVVLNIITLAICVGIIAAFRQSDKNNRSIEKAKRYGERIKEDLETFIGEKQSGLSELATELGVQQTRAIAAVKKLDEIYSQFMNNAGLLEDRSAAIQEIDRYIVKSEQTIQKLMDMTGLAEKNLTQITREADFVESLAKSITTAKAELNSVAASIPEMHSRFAEDADKKLDEYKTKILDEMKVVIEDVETRLSAAQKDTNDLLDVASIKLQDIYKQAYSDASDKAGALQEAAFAKLKEQTAEKVQAYRKEFEEMSAQIEEQMNRNLGETKTLAEDFKNDWQAQIDRSLEEMHNRFTEAETGLTQKLEDITGRVKETETMQDAALAELREQTVGKLENYRTEFEEVSARLETQLNANLNETKALAEDFKTGWQEQANQYLEDMHNRFTEAETGLTQKLEEIMERVRETEAVQDAALSELKDKTEERVQNYRKEFEQMSSQIEEEINRNLNETKRLADDFQTDWETQAKRYLEEMQNRFAEADNSLSHKIEEIMSRIKDAESLQDTALENLKNRTDEQVQSYQKEFEAMSSRIKDEMDKNLEDTKKSAENFKSEWQAQAQYYLKELQTNFSDAESNIARKMEGMAELIRETENSVSLRSDSISSDLSQTEATLRSQFNSIATNFQENMNSFAKFTDKKLNDFRTQTEMRFIKFEETIANVDTIKEEIEKLQTAAKDAALQEISAHAEAVKQDQHQFLADFEAKSEKIKERMHDIEVGIEELKAKSYTNVSDKLQSFEDELFADLAKRTDSVNSGFEQWKNDIAANMALLASENESARKDIEFQYKHDLRVRISQIAEEYKAHFSKLDEKVNEIENNLSSRLSAADDSIQKYTDKFREYVNDLQEKTTQSIESEFVSYKARLQDTISQQNEGIEEGSKELYQKLDGIREEANERFEDIKKDFEAWKVRTDQQFTDARSLFDDKITSFAGLTENAIKNFNAKYTAQYKEFLAKNEESFGSLQSRIASLDSKVAEADAELKNHADKAVVLFRQEMEKAEETLDKKIKSADVNAEISIQKINEMIHSVRLELDEAQDKVRENIQSESSRLNSVLEEIGKKQNDFINQTKVFERADELKAGLEKDIEEIKTEITRFEVYKNAIDNLTLQYDKVTQLENEANQKIAKFMGERKNIELLEAEFIKLTALSDTMDKKIIELTAVNDDLQQYQVQIRRIEEGIGDVNTRYERLEKKGAVLDQTMEGIDSAFESLKTLEADIKTFKDEVKALPSEIDKIKLTVDSLLSHQDKANNVYDKIESIDSMVEELNTKMDNLKNAREWLAATETRLQEISKDSQAQLKLMADLFKSEAPERNENGGPSVSVQENVLKLSRQGWKNTEIAKALNLSLGEVDLILEYSDKI